MASLEQAACRHPLGADSRPEARFKPQALLSTNLEYISEQMLTWFVRRWTMEVTLKTRGTSGH